MKSLSRRQVSTLRHLRVNGGADEDDLRAYHQGTIWSLLYQGYLVRYGHRRIGLSHDGEAVLREYNSSAPSYRKTEGDLTQRVQRLLMRVKVLQKIA